MHVRLSKEQKIKVLNGNDVYKIMREVLMRENKIRRDKEHFWIIGLNNVNTILFIELISLGTVNATIVEPMEVYSFALQKRAVKIVMVHNHPSGETQPSQSDKDVTNKMIQVGLFLKVPVIDHLIISDKSFYSFSESGLLEELGKSKKYVMPFLREEQRIAEKGKKEKAIEMARKMKKRGDSVEDIAEISGLSKRSILNLKTEDNNPQKP